MNLSNYKGLLLKSRDLPSGPSPLIVPSIYVILSKLFGHAAGEKLVGPCNTLFMDEISTGLDSSTTFLIVKCMRNFVHMAHGTVLMALLQPAPEVYDLFDDIMLLCEGVILIFFFNFWNLLP